MARVRPTSGPGRMPSNSVLSIHKVTYVTLGTCGQETYFLKVPDCLTCLVLPQALKLPTHLPRLTAQCGQAKPLMFSMSPITCSPVFLQKVSSRLTSPIDTACGLERGGLSQSYISQESGNTTHYSPFQAQPGWRRRPPSTPTQSWRDQQYLWCGDHKSPKGPVGAQGFHSGHVLIRSPWRCVHNQIVQLPPGHVRHKLLYQCCKDPQSPGVIPEKGLRKRRPILSSPGSISCFWAAPREHPAHRAARAHGSSR